MLLSHFSVLVMVVPRNLKCSTTVTDELLMTSGRCVGTFFRKSTITSTVLLTLSSRLLTAHQDSRWPVVQWPHLRQQHLLHQHVGLVGRHQLPLLFHKG